MRFISIGTACNVKHQIDQHFGKLETLFFDWLMVDIMSVITLLKCKSIEDILNIDTIKVDPITSITETNSRVIITSLSNCVSIHDVPINPTDEDINDFIDKYKRRYMRIVEYIRSNEKLCFIKYGHIVEVHKRMFIDAIQAINKDCDFLLVNINIAQPKSSFIKTKFWLEINLDDIPPVEDDWQTSYLDWKTIFKTISDSH